MERADRGGARLADRPDDLEPSAACRALGTDGARGLPADEAQMRLRSFGPNELAPPARAGRVRRFARQLVEPMVLLLVVAAAVSALALDEFLDAGAIATIVLLNATISYVQEGRAARALDALRSLEAPRATVVRDGRASALPARDLVLGDVILLHPGDRVPADARLLESASLEIDESLLTGESVPVHKQPLAVTPPDASLSQRAAIAFDGTLVTRGTARAVVVATGMGSEIGAIAERLGERGRATPLQLDLRVLSVRIGLAALVVATLVGGVLVARTGLRSETLERAFLVGVALAVAAVPEGLAAVTTVALSLGVKRMAERGGIIRNLPAVETLGATTVLAIDKTGTLTLNRMRVERFVDGRGRRIDPGADDPASLALAEVISLCSDATLDPPTGDPLELALLEAVGSGRVDTMRGSSERVGSVPFDADRKRMTTLHRVADGSVLAVKGAPERVLDRCRHQLSDEGVVDLADGGSALATADSLARGGSRVLAFARRRSTEPMDVESDEHDLVLIGLAALKDPVRDEAAGAVSAARRAGVTILMVTGDHPGTASSVAAEVGLGGEGLLTGADLRAGGLPPDPRTTAVYARVDPAQKLELVERLQALGEVVAVTGDGVNDAPALERADIGVALGRSGTDVAREASDLVITDDNLATIVSAMREGRWIYSNIRKLVDYLLTCNLSELVTVMAALLLFPDVGLPLLPLQLLWMNLVTDGLPALALGVDPPDARLMDRPPRPRDERLLDLRSAPHLAVRAIVLGVASLATLAIARSVLHEPWSHARAAMFTVLVVVQLLYAFAARRMRDDGRPLGPVGFLGSVAANRWLCAAVALGLVLQLAVVLFAPARAILGTHPLTGAEWMLVAIMSVGTSAVLAVLPSMRTVRAR